ncbi:unnamed protein product [Arabidopsis arenosa]|uniref:Uncharacterized protein n=1 Tax=Arabidopsis arenosa TaxID=38785 RepID=A0A8S1ZQ75_ARAAE|nr:unnamed protein product [Arabidopsis arenosa]
MGPESKGRAWFGKIYNKLETILVEVDSFTSQSTLCLKSSEPPGFESVRGESKEVAVDRSSGTYNVQGHHNRVDSPSFKSPFDPPSHQNFDIPGHVLVEKRVQGDVLKDNVVQRDSFEENSSAASLSDGETDSTSPPLEEYCDANMTSTTSLGAEEQLISDEEESQILPDEEILSTSPLLEEYHDANLTSPTTHEESHIINTLTPQKFSDEPKEVAKDRSSGASIVQQHHDTIDSPSCKSPSDPPPDQNFDISGHVLVEERVQGDIFMETSVDGYSFKENSSAFSSDDEEILSTLRLLEESYDANLTSDTTLGDEEPIINDTESQITNTLTTQKFSAGSSSVFPDGESVEEVRVESSLPDGEIFSTSSLFEGYCDANLIPATTLGDEEPIITDDESWITNRLTSQKSSAGNSLVFSGEESVEVKVKSCRDVVSTEPQSTQSLGTVVECNDDSSLNPLATKVPDTPVQDNVVNMRSSNADNSDDVINGKSDVTPLDSSALYGIEFQKDPSYVDDSVLYVVRARIIAELCGMESREDPYVEDSVLYAIHLRTEKLRSFKRKILDALTSKRRREKEYEQLPIWFGDADMGSDLATKEDSKQVEAIDSKSSQLLESEDSQWELL